MFQKNETCAALEECYLMSNIPKRNLASGCHLWKKIDQPSWRTTRRNYKHIPQIVCISSRFRVLHLLSWEFEWSEVLWRYTAILVCHLKHVEVGSADREIIIYSFFATFLYENEAPGLEQAAVVTMATRVLRPLKRAFLCIPPECLTACKIWRGVGNFHVSRCLILTETLS